MAAQVISFAFMSILIGLGIGVSPTSALSLAIGNPKDGCARNHRDNGPEITFPPSLPERHPARDAERQNANLDNEVVEGFLSRHSASERPSIITLFPDLHVKAIF